MTNPPKKKKNVTKAWMQICTQKEFLGHIAEVCIEKRNLTKFPLSYPEFKTVPCTITYEI